jgi:tail fiber protein gp53
MANNFVYTLGLPNPPDLPSTNVGDMQVNTNSINSLINVDHVGFNINGSGIHKQFTTTAQTVPGLGDGSLVIYGNTLSGDTVTGPTYPWYTVDGVNGKLLAGPSAASQNGYLYLPSGFIMQWGLNALSPYGTATNISFTTSPNIMFPTACYNVQATMVYVTADNKPDEDSVFVKFATVTQSGFTLVSSASSGTFVYWTAIGK